MKFTPRIHANGNVCCAAYNAAGEPIPSPSQCPICDEHFRALAHGELRTAEENTDDEPRYPPPTPYDFTQLRAAAAPPSTFEADYKAARLRDLEAMRTKLDAEHPRTLRTAEELAPYRAPDGYTEAIRALKDRERR
jgi:hypothetical protein